MSGCIHCECEVDMSFPICSQCFEELRVKVDRIDELVKKVEKKLLWHSENTWGPHSP